MENNTSLNTAYNRRNYNAGMINFLLSGICVISAGVIVSILRDRYDFSYTLTGMLPSAMSIGNMLALLVSGFLPEKIGEKATALLLSFGFFAGYLLMGVIAVPAILLFAFLIAGIAKGCTANKCTVLVGNNTSEKARSINLMNALFAIGALACPFIISWLQKFSPVMPMFGISFFGLLLWIVFLTADLPGKTAHSGEKVQKTDYSFLKNSTFWLLSALLFCQNSAEYTVDGWLVTYYKNEQILSGSLAAYTVTIQWGFMLIARLLIVYVFKIRNNFKALTVMGIGLTVSYAVLIRMHAPVPALIFLSLFAFSIAGVYPTAVASIGNMMNSASVGIMLSIAGVGGIVFPWLVGIIADLTNLRIGMALNLIPCVGIAVLPLLIIHKNS